MRWSDIQLDPPAKTLRQFAGLWLLFFLILSAWQGFLRDHWLAALIFAGLALTVGPIGLVWPRMVRHIFIVWMVLAFPIGWIVSHLMLGLLFYGVFTPVALLFKMIGRDALLRRPSRDRKTYWLPKSAPSTLRSYYRQF